MSKLCPKKLIFLGLFLIFGLVFALLTPLKASADGVPYGIAAAPQGGFPHLITVNPSTTIVTISANGTWTVAICTPNCSDPAKVIRDQTTFGAPGTVTLSWGSGAGPTLTPGPTPSGGGIATPLSAVADYFKRIINVVTAIAILIFLAMMFAGGFQFLFAGGDPKAIARARNTLTFAFIGLVVLLAVWFLLLAIQSVTGVPVTSFNLPTATTP